MLRLGTYLLGSRIAEMIDIGQSSLGNCDIDIKERSGSPETHATMFFSEEWILGHGIGKKD